MGLIVLVQNVTHGLIFEISILCLSAYEGFYVASMDTDTSIDFTEHSIRLTCFSNCDKFRKSI